MLLRESVKAALPNTQKQTWGGCQIEETKKYGPNERKEQNSRSRTNQNGDKQSDRLLIRCRVQTTVVQSSKRMLKELIKYGNKIKKTQAEMKVTLSEIKKNLQGTNSEGDKARAKSMIWNIREK